MNRLLKNLAAASFLIGLPLAAAAHDDDRYRAGRRSPHDHHYKYHAQDKHRKPEYYQAPPVVYHPAPPRVVGYRCTYRRRRRAAPWPLNQVDIGFRIFF